MEVCNLMVYLSEIKRLKMKRALVISGGGSKGAFAGGVAEYLMNEKGHTYDYFLGTSTGSLLVPHLALGKVAKVKKMYTEIKQEDVFNENPFTVSKKKGITNIGINHLHVLKMFAKGAKTFGESKALLSLIKRNFTKKEFNRIKSLNKEVVVTVSNITANRVEYKSIKDCTYSEFCEWIWISCNFVPFMSLVKKNKNEYADGGFSCQVPIVKAIEMGAKEIDVIVLHTENTLLNRMPSKNPFSLMSNMFEYLMDQVERKDIALGKASAKSKDVILNFYFIPNVMTTNALLFDTVTMEKWWRQGFAFAKKEYKTKTSDTGLDILEKGFKRTFKKLFS